MDIGRINGDLVFALFFSIFTYDFLRRVNNLSGQDMLLSLQRPISILGEVTTVNMSFHASFQSKDGQSILAGLENFPLTYNAVPGYCGWPNSVLSPVAQFDLSYLASAMELQLSSGLYTNADLLMNMMDNQDDSPIAGLYHVSSGPFSPGTGRGLSKNMSFGWEIPR